MYFPILFGFKTSMNSKLPVLAITEKKFKNSKKIHLFLKEYLSWGAIIGKPGKLKGIPQFDSKEGTMYI